MATKPKKQIPLIIEAGRRKRVSAIKSLPIVKPFPIDKSILIQDVELTAYRLAAITEGMEIHTEKTPAGYRIWRTK